MGMFYELLSKSQIFNSNMASGYSDSEIQNISRLYDINISNMLYDYFHDIGRCHGGALAVPNLNLMTYASRSVRKNLAGEIYFQNDLKEYYFDYYATQKPFNFATESYSYVMFLATDSESPDQLLCWDENENQIRDGGMTIYEYIKYWTFEHPRADEVANKILQKKTRHYWIGEMIDFDREGENKVSA